MKQLAPAYAGIYITANLHPHQDCLAALEDTRISWSGCSDHAQLYPVGLRHNLVVCESCEIMLLALFRQRLIC